MTGSTVRSGMQGGALCRVEMRVGRYGARSGLFLHIERPDDGEARLG